MMNIKDIHIRFDLRLRKIASHIEGNLLTEEVDIYLNRAIREFVKDVWDKQSKDRNEYSDSQRALDAIRKLERQALLVGGTFDSTENKVVYQLPTDYMHLIRERVYTNYCNKEKAVKGRLTSNEHVQVLLDNPFYTTHHAAPLVSIVDGTFNVFVNETFSNDRVLLTYLKRPVDVKLVLDVIEDIDTYNEVESVQCDVTDDDQVLDQIIDKAVSMALLDLGSPLAQPNIQLNTINQE